MRKPNKLFNGCKRRFRRTPFWQGQQSPLRIGLCCPWLFANVVPVRTSACFIMWLWLRWLSHPLHCPALLPSWITEHHPWVIDHPTGQKLALSTLANYYCYRPRVQDLVSRQLKLHPKLAERVGYDGTRLASSLLVQQIQQLLQQEARIWEELSWLSQVCTNLRDISTDIVNSSTMASSSLPSL